MSESSIVSTVAHEAATRITRKVIRELQRMYDTTSGNDSELKTTWDEICVQVQYEESVHWDAYDQTVRRIIEVCLKEIPNHLREAIYLQTDAGIEWCCNEEGEDCPVYEDDIIDYLAREYVYEEAGNWSNSRIRAFIERSSMRD